MGVPGWPEFAACTASIDRVRIVFTVSWSIGWSVVGAPVLVAAVIYALPSEDRTRRSVATPGNRDGR
jgi:hypothetical protein